MQDSYRFVKREGRFYVAWTGARFDEPVIFTRFYPVSVDRSQGVMSGDETLNISLRTGSSIHNGAIYYFNTMELKPGDVSVACERRLQNAVIVAMDGETPIVEFKPYPAPKTKLETRYHRGRWEKLHSKRGWIAA